ncbi:MAG TPA: hypothetical protein DCQ98_09420 [Planctomycetaceae bacterium]|nr:hypothetical protein [Planctomycetaceae bacterium]
MPGTLTLTASAEREFDNSPRLPIELEQLEIVLTNQQLSLEEWIVGTSEEDMTVGDVANQGYLILVNVDPTNTVEWGPKSGGSMVGLGTLYPKRWAIIELKAGVVIRAVASVAPVKLYKVLFGN